MKPSRCLIDILGITRVSSKQVVEGLEAFWLGVSLELAKLAQSSGNVSTARRACLNSLVLFHFASCLFLKLFEFQGWGIGLDQLT